MKNLLSSLIKFQSQVPAIPKNKINPFFSKGGNISRYADLSQIIDICLPVLNKNDLCIYQSIDAPELSEESFLITTLAHLSGEVITSKMRLPQLNDPQKMMAAITYYRRTSYISILGLVAEDDDDGNSLNNQAQKPKANYQANYEQPKQSEDAASPAQINAMKKMRIEFKEGITKKEASQLIAAAANKRNQ